MSAEHYIPRNPMSPCDQCGEEHDAEYWGGTPRNDRKHDGTPFYRCDVCRAARRAAAWREARIEEHKEMNHQLTEFDGVGR